MRCVFTKISPSKDVDVVLGPVHTELLAIALALAIQKMGRISIVSDALLMLTLSLRAQCE